MLFEELSRNIELFLLSISNLENYSQKEIEMIVINEIKKQYSEKNSNLFNKAGFCEDALNSASSNCEENYAISVAVVVVSGFWSFGVGTVIGYAAATALMVKCYEDASAAYRECSANQ